MPNDWFGTSRRKPALLWGNHIHETKNDQFKHTPLMPALEFLERPTVLVRNECETFRAG